MSSLNASKDTVTAAATGDSDVFYDAQEPKITAIKV